MSKEQYLTLSRLMLALGTSSHPRLLLSRAAALLAFVVYFPQTQAGCSLHQFSYSPGDGSPQPCPSSGKAEQNWDANILEKSTCLILPSSYLRSVFKVYLEDKSEAYQIYPSRSANCQDGTSNHKFYTDYPPAQCFAWSETGIAANDYLIFKCGADSSDTISALTATHFISASASAMSKSFTTSVGVADPSSQSEAGVSKATSAVVTGSGSQSETVVPKATEPPEEKDQSNKLQKESNKIALGVGIGFGLPMLLAVLWKLWVKRGSKRTSGLEPSMGLARRGSRSRSRRGSEGW